MVGYPNRWFIGCQSLRDVTAHKARGLKACFDDKGGISCLEDHLKRGEEGDGRS